MHEAADQPAKSPPGRWALFQGILPLDKSQVGPDILAGITLAAVNIPQAMGYTKIAGTPAVTGLYTLLLPVIAFAMLGSSRYLVVAADSATAAILAVSVGRMAEAGTPKYVALAAMVALLAAAFLLLARLLRLGFLADFLSRTVLIGFLTGVGIQVGIAVSGEMLGIPVSSHSTAGQLSTVLRHLSQIHWPTFAVAAGVVGVILATRRFAPRLPGPLLAVAGAIALSAALDFAGHGIAVLGAVAGGLPRLGFPDVSWSEAMTLLPTAGACFVMIMAQSSVTARAYAARHRQTLDQNRDLLGLCAADAAAAFSGTFDVNGSPTQTAMVETSPNENDPWSSVLQYDYCERCGYPIPMHLGERWDALSLQDVRNEWVSLYRSAKTRPRKLPRPKRLPGEHWGADLMAWKAKVADSSDPGRLVGR